MSADHRPPPPYGSEADLSGFRAMQFDVDALIEEGQAAQRSDPAAFWASLTLRAYSWKQRPSGSLPNDGSRLMHAAGIRNLRVWERVRAFALEGWREHSDGRLYHPVMTEKVLAAAEKTTLRRGAGSKGGRPKSAQVAPNSGASPTKAPLKSDLSGQTQSENPEKSMAGEKQSLSIEVEENRRRGEDPSGLAQARTHEAEPSPIPEPEPPPKPKPSRKSPAVAMPAAWASDPRSILDSPAALNAALNRGMTPQEADHEARQFADYHLARDSRFASWDAAWRTWCGNWAQFRSRRSGSGPSGGNGSGGSRRGASLVDTIMRGRAERNSFAGGWPPSGRA